MYRYTIDNAITYTQGDLALFRESPFAVWMERLTLENPEHGILPDHAENGPPKSDSNHADIAETLRAEGRRVIEIERDADEAERRTATIAAMKGGADFIVDGQLAADNLSGRADLLMRTSGYSELGDFLYVPCETRAGEKSKLVFRLAFFADLLHMLQGQLPPQLLIIRDNVDVLSLQTEDHIHYYRAVAARFSAAMSAFRKHRMPNPAESCYFGRWAECASEVLKQRAARDDARAEEEAQQRAQEGGIPDEEPEEQLAQVVAGAERVFQSETARVSKASTNPAGYDVLPAYTLVEQARQLDPGHFNPGAAPGRAPNLAAFPLRPSAEASERSGQGPELVPTTADAALDNLQFTGHDRVVPTPGMGTEMAASDDAFSDGGAAALQEQGNDREHVKRLPTDTPSASLADLPAVVSTPIGESASSPEKASTPLFLPPDTTVEEPAVDAEPSGGEEGSANNRLVFAARPMVDSDNAPSPALAPARSVSEQQSEEHHRKEHLDSDISTVECVSAAATATPDSADDEPAFDSRLNTSEGLDD